jgi:hypothetical protein
MGDMLFKPPWFQPHATRARVPIITEVVIALLVNHTGAIRQSPNSVRNAEKAGGGQRR